MAWRIDIRIYISQMINGEALPQPSLNIAPD
jgi:hypothetical protein